MGLKLSDLTALPLASINDSDLIYIVNNGVSYAVLVNDLKDYVGQSGVSGTTSYIPVFNESGGISDSLIRELNGKIGIGTAPSEALTVNGNIALLHQVSPTEVAGQGIIYAKSDGFIYFKNASGTEYNLTQGGGSSSVQIAYNNVLTFANEYGYNNAVVLEGNDVFSLAGSGHNVAGVNVISYKIDPAGFTPIFPSSFLNKGDETWSLANYMRIWFTYDGAVVTYTFEQLEALPSTLATLTTPTNVQAVGSSATEITVSWTDIANESNYEVQVSLNGTDGWTTLSALIAANATSYLHSGLVEGNTRYYRMRGIGDGVTYGNSAWSAVVSATTSSSTQVATPTITSVVGIDSKTNQINWNDVSGDQGYEVYRRDTGDVAWTLLTTTAASAIVYEDGTAIPEGDYDYSIIATGNGTTTTDSARSNVVSIITDAVVTPTLSLESGDTQITANFGNIDVNADATEFERSLDGSTGWTNVEEHTSPDIDGVIDGGLTNYTKYYYRYRVGVSGIYSAYAERSMIPGGFADEFTGEIINSHLWTKTDSSDIVVTQNDELIFTDQTTNASAATASLLTNTKFNFNSTGKVITLRFDIDLSSQVPENELALVSLLSSNGNDGYGFIRNSTTGVTNMLGYWRSGGVTQIAQDLGVSPTGSWKMVLSGGTINWYKWNGASWGASLGSATYNNSSDFYIRVVRSAKSTTGNISKVDNLYLKYNDYSTLIP